MLQNYFFQIYDTDSLLRSYCQSDLPSPIRSSSNMVKIHYHTDSSAADSSFQLHYEVENGDPTCGGLFTEISGTISMKLAKDCNYLIQQPKDLKIELKVTNGRLSKHILTCQGAIKVGILKLFILFKYME